ncbi:MAG: zinc ribbon domain-containing protein [Dehalococcoidia bacterium]|nr:zinc ribbon domain-containing protein [Dehalococcoidia bacterium]
MGTDESSKKTSCPNCGCSVSDRAKFCEQCGESLGGCTAEEWGAMFRNVMKSMPELLKGPDDPYIPESVALSEKAILTYLNYDKAKSCMPRDPGLSLPHAALLRLLEQSVVLSDAFEKASDCRTSVEENGHSQPDEDRYLAAIRDAKEAHSVWRARLVECKKVMDDLAENNKQLYERLNLELLAVVPFEMYVATVVIERLQLPEGISYIGRDWTMELADVHSCRTLFSHAAQQAFVTCVRAGIEHPRAIPTLLYPDDEAKRTRMTQSPKSDPQLTGHPCVSYAQACHNLNREPNIIYWTVTACPLSGIQEFETEPSSQTVSDSEVSAVAKYARSGLLLAAADKVVARMAIDESIRAYFFREREHRQFADGLIHDYERKFGIKVQ